MQGDSKPNSNGKQENRTSAESAAIGGLAIVIRRSLLTRGETCARINRNVRRNRNVIEQANQNP